MVVVVGGCMRQIMIMIKGFEQHLAAAAAAGRHHTLTC